MRGWSQLVVPLLAFIAAGPLNSLAEPPSDPQVEAYLDKADAYFEAGNFEAAVREYDGAISIAGPTERLLSLRGGAKFRLGDYRGADADVTRAIQLNPGDAYLFLLRALSRSLFKPPDREGTCSDFEQARMLGLDIREVADGIEEWCVNAEQ